jgi:adenylosuccinate synthase
MHPVPERSGVGQARGDHVARRNLRIADTNLGGAVETELVQGLEDVDEFVAAARRSSSANRASARTARSSS